jgi:hypothetical protein
MRYSVAAAGAAALVLTIGGVGLAAGGPGSSGPAAAPSAAALAATQPGSELQFLAVAPCRIVDTRVTGGALNASARTFTADGPYTSQGGNAAGCGIPANIAVAVQVNLGAIAAGGAKGWAKAWAAGTTEPLASIINYPADAPISNMVTIPVSATSNFNIRTSNKAQIFADIAGYYVKPLYASIDAQDGTPTVWLGVASGLVSVERSAVGTYQLTFDRNVTHCVATATDFLFSPVHEISVDSTFSDDSTVYVQVKDSSTGAPDDTLFHISLTC